MTLRVGDTVHLGYADSPKYAGTYKIIKVNPTTYVLSGDRSKNLKVHHELVSPGPLSLTASTTAVVEQEEFFDSGSVVHIKAKSINPDTLFVVTGQVSRGYRCFPLGGSPRYYTGIPARQLTRVTEIHDWKA